MDDAKLIAHHFASHREVVEASLEKLRDDVLLTGRTLVSALRAGGKVIAFGNGGSATQASHLAGELVGRFSQTRKALPALALSADTGVVTCIGNDFGFGTLFERQVEAFAVPGDVVVGLTTSGKSENALLGLAAAQRKGAVSIALTGAAGLAGGQATHVLAVPSTDTAIVQEVHLMVLHVWCRMVDAALGAT